MNRARQLTRRPAAATVELAVLLPFLVYLGVISTDWARLFYYTITVESCARNGALYASDAEIAAKSGYTSLGQAALAEAPLLDTSGTTATTTTSGSTTTTTYAPASGDWVVKVSKTTTTDAANNAAVICTVEVPFKTITKFPGVPNSQTLTRNVQMRMAALAIR